MKAAACAESNERQSPSCASTHSRTCPKDLCCTSHNYSHALTEHMRPQFWGAAHPVVGTSVSELVADFGAPLFVQRRNLAVGAGILDLNDLQLQR